MSNKQNVNHCLYLRKFIRVSDDETMERITNSLNAQLGDSPIFPVSSVRHRRGVEQDIPIFIEKAVSLHYNCIYNKP
ncbi:hypothetical protein OURE66S_02338 [Oligella ureolytica]